MNRRDFLGGALIALAAGSHAWAQGQAGPPTDFRDLTPDFWRVYDAGRGIANPQERAQALEQGFVTPHADIDFAGQAFDGGPRRPVDRGQIMSWLKGFDPLAPAVKVMSEQLPAAWSAHRKRFSLALPDVDDSAPGCALISFGRFSTDVQSLNGKATVVVAPDSIVQKQGDHADLAVVLDQAAFPLYQQRVNPAFAVDARMMLWSRLWCEGLAEYASQQLNPGAAQGDVLMDNGRLAIFTPSSVVAELLGEQDSASALDIARFFDPSYQGDIPPRTGYLLGLLVVERVGRDYTLPQLARLPAAQARALVQTGLSQIADG